MILLYAAGGLALLVVVGGFIYMMIASSGGKKIMEALEEQEQMMKKMGFNELSSLVDREPEAVLTGGLVRRLSKDLIVHDDAEILQVRINMMLKGNADLMEEKVVTKRREHKG